ncbi:MAG TPA: RusA family crossover junction endodeoxyribonuclease [Roseomonas sp.]
MSGPIIIVVPGEAVPFARAGGNGRQRFTPAKQRNAMAVIKQIAADAMGEQSPLAGPVRMILRATYVPPQSWSKKRIADSLWKATKPDVDNILKLAKDSLNGIVYHDDAQVADLMAQKRYGVTASLTITVEPLEAR